MNMNPFFLCMVFIRDNFQPQVIKTGYKVDTIAFLYFMIKKVRGLKFVNEGSQFHESQTNLFKNFNPKYPGFYIFFFDAHHPLLL